MIALIKPILVKFATSEPVKKLVIELLEKLVESTDTELDDAALNMVKKGLGYTVTKSNSLDLCSDTFINGSYKR